MSTVVTLSPAENDSVKLYVCQDVFISVFRQKYKLEFLRFTLQRVDQVLFGLQVLFNL